MRLKFLTRIITFFSALVAGGGIAGAIPTTSDVTLDSQSGNEVTLISAAVAPKSKDAETMAVKQAFFAILDQGVEGLHSGQPMLTTPSKEFNYTFYKDGKYVNYLTAAPLKLDDAKISNNHRVSVKVTINLNKLKKDLSIYNLTLSPAWQDKKEVKATVALNPTIVVVPYLRSEDQSFQAMKDAVDSDNVVRHVVNAVSSQFAAHGYKTRDFATMLANSKTDDIMQEGTATDARTMVIQELPADIVVTVDIDRVTQGNKGQCTLNIDAVERQTAGKLGSVSYGSGQYMTTDFIALSDHALKKVEGAFFAQLQDAFKQMVEKGREMKLEFLLGETVSDWDFDIETPVTEVDFKEELEEWLRSTANHGIYDMSQSTDKYIGASINLPLWDAEKNRSYSLSNFNSALKKFLKKHLGDSYRGKVSAMGQKLVIIIE